MSRLRQKLFAKLPRAAESQPLFGHVRSWMGRPRDAGVDSLPPPTQRATLARNEASPRVREGGGIFPSERARPGCVAGMSRWAAIVVCEFSPGSTSVAQLPGFVDAIIVPSFELFNIFAVGWWLRHHPLGRFADYLLGEGSSIALHSLAKSALTWRVFAGILAPSAHTAWPTPLRTARPVRDVSLRQW